jgi:hypothetical protein
LWIHLSHGFAVLDDVSIGDRQRILDIHFNPGTWSRDCRSLICALHSVFFAYSCSILQEG